MYSLTDYEGYGSYDENDIKVSLDIKETLDALQITKNMDLNIERVKQRKINDNYKVLSMLGTGLFSKVYLVEDSSGQKFAMKVISKADFKSDEHIKKILIEKEIMKRLSHRNILKLYKTFQTKHNFYLIIEYAEKGL